MNLIERIFAAAGDANNAITPIDTAGGAGASSITGLVTVVLNWLFYGAGVAAVIYLVYSGILYISAAGNPDQAKKGQQGIINAIIGIIVIVLALTIVSVVKRAAQSGTLT